jgi:hypothetical protein
VEKAETRGDSQGIVQQLEAKRRTLEKRKEVLKTDKAYRSVSDELFISNFIKGKLHNEGPPPEAAKAEYLEKAKRAERERNVVKPAVKPRDMSVGRKETREGAKVGGSVIPPTEPTPLTVKSFLQRNPEKKKASEENRNSLLVQGSPDPSKKSIRSNGSGGKEQDRLQDLFAKDEKDRRAEHKGSNFHIYGNEGVDGDSLERFRLQVTKLNTGYDILAKVMRPAGGSSREAEKINKNFDVKVRK